MEQLLDYKQRPQLERILEMLKKMDDTTQRVLCWALWKAT